MTNQNNTEKTFLKFEWNVDDWINIQDLSESLIWYEKFLKSSFKAFDVNVDEIEIKIFDIRKWSIIVDIIFQYDWNLLFWNIQNFLDIIKTIDLNLYNYIENNLINSIWNKANINFDSILRNIEKYWRENPVRTWFWVWIWTYYSWKILDALFIIIYKLIVKWKIKYSDNIDKKSDEEEIDFEWTKVKAKYIKKLKEKVINKWKAKELLEPIINDFITKIKIWNDENIIDSNNLDLFLWKWNQILPFLINWEKHEFIWSFTAMQSNKWETMKFKSQLVKINWKMNQTKNKHWDDFLFVVNLPHWKTTENYLNFYWESKILKLNAEILRENEYKKPKLKLLKVELVNEALFNIENL